MRRMIVLSGSEYELVASDWPFEDDEAWCLDLVEFRLRQLDNPHEAERERVLAASIAEATVDYYGTGGNAFACELQLSPVSELARCN